MSKRVEIGEEWFIVSMKWIKKWQEHVGFESESQDESARGPNPGKIDSTDIVLGDGAQGKLDEMSNKHIYLNF